MALTFLEHVETESPTTSQFAVDGGKSTSSWLLQTGTGTANAVTVADIQAAITQILGVTAYAAGDGRLMRTPPLADPMYGWLFADSISSIKGVGQYVKTAAPATLEVPPLPFYALYPNYWFQINFTPRPYPVFTDANVTKTSGSWYNFSGTSQSYQYVTEYERYLDYQLAPAFDTISGQQGSLIFDSTTTAANAAPFIGTPKMQLPNQMLKLIWFNVPYRYVTSTNSFISFFPGYINQNFLTLQGQQFPPGSLQYVGYNPVKFTPPVQAVSAVVPGVFSTEKLCNIELSFRYTTRFAKDLPGPSNAATASGYNLPNGKPVYFQNTNKNFVMGGWNLLPWLPDRKFHYARTNATGVTPQPSWYSFPAELLFYDPDASDAYQVNTADA